MTADDYAWPDYADHARRNHTAEATVTHLRAEIERLQGEIDRMVHDGLVACAHDGKRTGQVGVPTVVKILCGLPIPWEHVGQEVHECENAAEHEPPRGCVKFASWAPDGTHDDGVVA